MDISKMTVLDPSTIGLEMNTEKHSKTLYRSICVPSTMQSYSLAIEFMQSWFTSKFPKDQFKYIHIEGKHVFDDYRRMDDRLMLRKPRPSLSIVPSFSWDFDDEKIDAYPFGLSLYTAAGQFKDSFLKDPRNDVYMGIGLEVHLLQFQFKVRLETRAQQLDMYKYIKMACRVGFTEGRDIDLDFHMPYEIMLQMASDVGFEVIPDTNGELRIKKVTEFLRYINSHSQIPFLYKHRNVNGKNEFFIRMHNMYVHIRPGDMNADDGERDGQINNSFTIELNTEVRFPAPKMYAYYSNHEHKMRRVYGAVDANKDADITSIYTFKSADVPEHNDRDWILYLTSSYLEDDITKPLVINFNDLFEGNVQETINETLASLISPSIFLDIKIANFGEFADYTMDWSTGILTTKKPVQSKNSFIAVYCDMEYLNNHIISQEEDAKDRLDDTRK